MSIYNDMKLSVYRPLFRSKGALVIGSGAVGTHLMEKLAKMGISPDAIDYDHFTLENAAKHGCLVRTPEDVGRNKAECTSERVQPLLEEGCASNGIDADICKLGPEAYADYDYVIVAVDNHAAKVLLNEQIRLLPEDRRPYVIVDGTYDEMASSVILDNKEFCMRCLLDEAWLKDSSIKTSCVGPQIREVDGEDIIIRTSNCASSMAAHLSCEQFRGSVLGYKNVMNHRLTYTAYPNLELSSSHPLRKRNCPGCAIRSHNDIKWLHGSVLDITLKEAIEQIGKTLDTQDFEITTHHLNYKKVVYAGFIVDDSCLSCGKSIKVMRHEGRLYPTDLLCEQCSAKGEKPHQNTEFNHGDKLYAFTSDTDNAIKDMTLYNLGYPLGAHIEVIQRNGALDFLDEGIIKTIFAFEDDHLKMHEIHKL